MNIHIHLHKPAKDAKSKDSKYKAGQFIVFNLRGSEMKGKIIKSNPDETYVVSWSSRAPEIVKESDILRLQ